MKRAWLLLLAACGAPAPLKLAAPARSVAVEPVREAKSELRRAADEAAAYLAAACQPDGKFVYLRHLDPKVEVRDDYNVVRHAGAIYALAQYHRRYGGDEVQSAIVRAWAYLRAHHLAPVPGRSELAAVWDDDLEDDPARHAKLGGAGLGLAAATAAEGVVHGSTPPALGRQLAEFLLEMEKPDGATYSKYDAARGKSDDWDSLYYPGEAALALSLWNRLDPSPRWLVGARTILAHLAEERRGAHEVPADHWALIATADLLAQLDQGAPDRALLYEHARQVAGAIVGDQDSAGHPRGSREFGSFDPDGRTTPAATRLEGLIAALPLLADDPGLQARVRRAIDLGGAFLLRARVTSGRWRGGMPRAIGPRPDDYAGSPFSREAGEIRIDYVQHALSAWLGMIELDGAR